MSKAGKAELTWGEGRAVPGCHASEPRVHEVCGQVVLKGEVVTHFLHEDHQHGGVPSVRQFEDVAVKILVKGGGKLARPVHHGHLHCLVPVQVECVLLGEDRVKRGQPFPCAGKEELTGEAALLENHSCYSNRGSPSHPHLGRGLF